MTKIIILSLFIITRLFIWFNPPTDFTQIIAVFMPYAHLWAGGQLPYINQWYEYPPLTIPIFYLPHLIDTTTNHHWYHINYSIAFRGLMLATDIGVFSLIYYWLKKQKTPNITLIISLIYYSLVTAKANHFIYDAFDLIFIAMILLSLITSKFTSWISFFAATAIKYINLPLILPILFHNQRNLAKSIIMAIIALLITWGWALIWFKSSLLVTFEYHKQRGLQVESFPATLARTLDRFTHTEHFAEIAKAYDIQGPISSSLKQIFSVIFPGSLIIYLVFVTFFLTSLKTNDDFMIWVTLGYISLFMITSPVLSTPYLLWHIPLVAILPTQKLITKLILILTSSIIIIAGMTKFPDSTLYPLTIHIWIGWIKMLGFLLIFTQTVKHLWLNYR